MGENNGKRIFILLILLMQSCKKDCDQGSAKANVYFASTLPIFQGDTAVLISLVPGWCYLTGQLIR